MHKKAFGNVSVQSFLVHFVSIRIAAAAYRGNVKTQVLADAFDMLAHFPLCLCGVMRDDRPHHVPVRCDRILDVLADLEGRLAEILHALVEPPDDIYRKIVPAIIDYLIVELLVQLGELFIVLRVRVLRELLVDRFQLGGKHIVAELGPAISALPDSPDSAVPQQTRPCRL